MQELNTVFRLTLEDFEALLGRELNDKEKDLIFNRFNIDDWADHVIDFLDYHDIKRS